MGRRQSSRRRPVLRGAGVWSAGVWCAGILLPGLCHCRLRVRALSAAVRGPCLGHRVRAKCRHPAGIPARGSDAQGRRAARPLVWLPGRIRRHRRFAQPQLHRPLLGARRGRIGHRQQRCFVRGGYGLQFRGRARPPGRLRRHKLRGRLGRGDDLRAFEHGQSGLGAAPGGVHIGIDDLGFPVLPFVAAAAQRGAVVHFQHVAQAPVHACSLDLPNPVGVFLAAHDVGGHDDQQFGAAELLAVVAEEEPHPRQIAQQRHLAADHGGVLGDQAAEDDGLAAGRADGGLGRDGLDPRGADHLAGGGNRDRHTFFFRADLGFLGVDFHDHHSVRADARGDTQDQAHGFELDVVDLAGLADLGPGNARHTLANLDEGRLIVERHDLGPAEHVQSPALFQGANEHAHTFARCAEDETAVAQLAVDAPQAEMRDSLGADPSRNARPPLAAALPERLVVEGEAGVEGGRGDHLVGRDRVAQRIECGRRGGDNVAQQAAVEEHRVLQSQLEPQLFRVIEHHFGQDHLDHHHGRTLVELFDQAHDFVVEARRGTDDQAVADRLGHHDHLAFDLLKGAEQSGLDLLHLALALQELVDGRGHVDGRRVFQPVDDVLATAHVALVQAEEDRLDHLQVAARAGGDDAVGAHIHGEAQRHERAFALLGRGLHGRLVGRGLGEQRAEHLGQRGGIAVDDGKHLDLGLGRGQTVQLLHQRRNQLHAVRGCRDQERVGTHVGRHAHVRQDARAELAPPLAVDGHEPQHHRFLLAPGLRGLARRPRGSLAHDGLLEDRRDLVGHGVLKLKHAQLVDRLADRRIEPLDHRGHLFHVARAGLNNERIGTEIGHHQHARPEPFALLEKLFHGGLGRLGPCIAQAEHSKLRVRSHRTVELLHQLDHPPHVLRPADQQQGVGLDQRGNAHRPLARQVDFLIQRHEQLRQSQALHVAQVIHLHGRLGLGSQPLDLLDQFYQAFYVPPQAANHQHVEPFEQLHLHRSDQIGLFRLLLFAGRRLARQRFGALAFQRRLPTG